MRQKRGRFQERKSQASFEFLTTYGWAILLILVTLSALTYFGILNPRSFLPERCNFGSEVGCLNQFLGQKGTGTGLLRLQLRNNLAESIVVNTWKLSSESATPFDCLVKPPQAIWLSHEAQDFEFSFCNNLESGLAIGEKGKVRLAIDYYPAKASATFLKTVEGEILATVMSLDGTGSITECMDGLDNDGNGCADYSGGDGGCADANDQTESAGACQPLPLSCTVSAACPDTDVFHMSDLESAHAEMPGLFNFAYKVCCKSGTDTLSNACSSPDAVLLHLSRNTDAHVEKSTGLNYNVNVCLSATTKDIACRYASNNCDGTIREICVATIASDTDSNVADCVTNPYPIKICCRVS